MGFKSWLHKQWRRRDPVGDLARDARHDRTWPRGPASLQRLRQYLISCGACDGALDALCRAWREYQHQKRNGGEDGR